MQCLVNHFLFYDFRCWTLFSFYLFLFPVVKSDRESDCSLYTTIALPQDIFNHTVTLELTMRSIYKHFTKSISVCALVAHLYKKFRIKQGFSFKPTSYTYIRAIQLPHVWSTDPPPHRTHLFFLYFASLALSKVLTLLMLWSALPKALTLLLSLDVVLTLHFSFTLISSSNNCLYVSHTSFFSVNTLPSLEVASHFPFFKPHRFLSKHIML